MENSFKRLKLKDILREKGYIRGPFGSALKRGEMKEKGIPVYEQSNAIYNNRNFRYFIDDEKFDTLKRFQVRKNDIIISCSGTVGCISLIKENDPLGIISQALLILRSNDKIILPEFLMYFLKSSKGHNSILSRSSGSVQVNIARRQIIENIDIDLPKIEVQRKIVKILSAFDDKIQLNNEMNKTLEEMAQAIFKSCFVDFKPFKDGEFEESELGMIPKGWKIVRLSDIGNIVTGKTPSKKNFEYFGDNFKFITPKDIKGDVFIINSIRGLSDEGYKKMAKIKFDKYSIGVSCIGSDLGEVYLNDKIGFSNQQINTITLNDINIYPYIYITLKNMKSDFKNIASGSAVPIINKTTFSKIKIILPKKEVYDEYFRKVSDIFERILTNLRQNNNLRETRDILLPKLISGEIRIN